MIAHNFLLAGLTVFFISGPSIDTVHGEDKLHIYMRAFIPKEHATNPGYVKQVTGKPNFFVIPSPIPGDTSCYQTDNRMFSSGTDESSRVTIEFVLIVNDGSVKIESAEGREKFRTGWTHKVDCNTGEDLVEKKMASKENMHIGAPAIADGLVQVSIDARASNPLVIVKSPSIAFSGLFTFDVNKQILRFKGSSGVFPAHEGYVRLNNGDVKTIMRYPPMPNTTAMDLLDLGTGLKLQSIDTSVELGSGFNGNWQSTDSEGRFKLQINGTDVILTERNSSGELKSTMKASSEGNSLKISRPNDDQVLRFIGYQNTLRQQIISRTPNPSYMVIRKDGGKLKADWFGLLVIKDNKANLREVKQPGTAPSKAYTFARSQ